jgi:hypothetical protein
MACGSLVIKAIRDIGDRQDVRINREHEAARRATRAGHDTGTHQRVQHLAQVAPRDACRSRDLIGPHPRSTVVPGEKERGAECVVCRLREHRNDRVIVDFFIYNSFTKALARGGTTRDHTGVR